MRRYKSRKDEIGFGPKIDRKAYRREYQRIYRNENPNKKSSSKYDKGKEKKKRLEKRRRALLIYGNKCKNCGIEEEEMLQFHHKEGRRKERSRDVYNRIVTSGYQEDLELLCANCHILANLRDGTSWVSRPSEGFENLISLDNFI